MIKLIDRFYKLNKFSEFNSVADAINSFKVKSYDKLYVGFFCIDASDFFVKDYAWVQGITTLQRGDRT